MSRLFKPETELIVTAIFAKRIIDAMKEPIFVYLIMGVIALSFFISISNIYLMTVPLISMFLIMCYLFFRKTFLPFYLRDFLKENNLDKQTVKLIKKEYFKSIVPVLKYELFINFILFAFFIVSYIPFGLTAMNDWHNKVVEYIVYTLLFIGVIVTIFDLKRRFNNTFIYVLNQKRKKAFIKFIYSVYTKNPELAEKIVEKFKDTYRLYRNYKDVKYFKMELKEKEKLAKNFEKFNNTKELPKNKKDLIETIFAVLINDFKIGIETIKEAQKINLKVI
jgi:hypothetical protein